MKDSAKKFKAPLNTELTKLKTVGALPKWLKGKLVRNGPALFEVGDNRLNHWFDGYGMLHGFNFQDGEVFYHSKYIESEEYLKSSTSGKVSTIAWGTASDPCKSIFRRFQANFTAQPSNTNVNVVKIGDSYYATSDIATINEFDIEDLDTLSNLTLEKTSTAAAHPGFTSDGRVWNMTSKFSPRPKNTIISIDKNTAIIKHKTFSANALYYFHSFGVSDDYFVSIEQPMKLDFGKLMKSGIQNKSFYECFEWRKEENNILHIYNNNDQTYQKIPLDIAFFFFHTINTFEKDGILTVDLCGYENNNIVEDFYIDTLATTGIKDENKSRLYRLSINLDAGTAEAQVIDVNIELPNINHAYGGREYRYAYGVHSPGSSPHLGAAIIKYDFKESTHQLWQEDGLLPGEPIFVSSPDANDEDDGVLLVMCHSESKGLSELVTLDSKTLEKISTSQVSQSIPPMLHGNFYANQ